MLILAVDTTTAKGSLALARDGRLIEARCGLGERTHGERLPSEIIGLLGLHDVALSDIDRFVVAAGPGSFTGLRIGLGMAKTLGWACQRPVIGLDAVEIAARRAVCDGNAAIATGFMVCVPGFKKTIFMGRYTWDGHVLSRTGELEWVDGMDKLQEKTRENEPIFVPGTSELQFPGTTPVSDDVPAAVILAALDAARGVVGRTAGALRRAARPGPVGASSSAPKASYFLHGFLRFFKVTPM